MKQALSWLSQCHKKIAHDQLHDVNVSHPYLRHAGVTPVVWKTDEGLIHSPSRSRCPLLVKHASVSRASTCNVCIIPASLTHLLNSRRGLKNWQVEWLSSQYHIQIHSAEDHIHTRCDAVVLPIADSSHKREIYTTLTHQDLKEEFRGERGLWEACRHLSDTL